MTSTFVQKRHELLVDRIDRFAVLLDLSKKNLVVTSFTLPEWTLIGVREVRAEAVRAVTRDAGSAKQRPMNDMIDSS